MLSIIGILSMGSCSSLEGDIDLCENITCENGGTCDEGICDCPDGFSGTNCEIEDLCITNPIECQNGGTANSDCTACDCPEGTSGLNCETVWRDALIGSYDVQSECDNLPIYGEAEITISEEKVTRLNYKFVNGDIYHANFKLYFDMTSSSTISIPSQPHTPAQQQDFEGEGTVSEDGVVHLNDPNGIAQCRYTNTPK